MAGKKVDRLTVPNTYHVDGMAPVTSVNNILPVNGNVTLPIPTVPTNVSAFTNDAGYLTSATLAGYATQSWVQQQGYLTSVPSQYITDTELSTTLASYVTSADLSTTLAGYAQTTDIPTVGNGTITINQGGVQKGTFTLNQSGNSTINLDAGGSSGTVDQTYDSTSANAQSGVAIAGAGFLQNTATGSYALTILGTAQTAGKGTNVGYYASAGQNSSAFGYYARATGQYAEVFGSNSTASGNWSIIIGHSGTASGDYSIAIGSGASASANRAIQLGTGTNSTANSLQIGFSGSDNYILLDGTTGLIPDTRISSNIARTSAIPTVPTNISSFTNDSGYITGITSSDITTTLGYTPYSDANPNGYTSNTGTVTSVNNSQPDASGNVTLSIPTVPTNVSAFTNDSGYITGITSNDVTDALGYTPYNSTNPDGYQTSSDVNTAVTNAISTLLGNLYPVGSVYIGTQATCPLATLISGSTWELVAEDRVLQGSSTNHTANTTVAAGLPNITGSITSRPLSTQYTGAITGATGAFTYTRNGASGTTTPVSVTGTAVKGDATQFNASHSSSVYGNSTTVQPPAYVVNVWRRTA